MEYKSGFVSVIGRPNVGKSTLVNNIVGNKVSIISDKPQTTRNTIKAVVSRENFQIIFLDTPGLHKPKNKLGVYMVTSTINTLEEVDIVLFMIEATDSRPGPGDLYIIEQLKKIKTPIFLIINKVDLIKKEQVLSIIEQYRSLIKFKSIIPISAIKEDGIDVIIDELLCIIPEGPQYFPDHYITDQPEKLVIAEFIREKALENLSEEVPHGVGVEITHFNERDNKNIIDINATIYCEKQSHKGILIGKNGSMLKKIGSSARFDIERLLGTKVFLEIWVKVKSDWRNSASMLKTLGYHSE
jgi:GTP-binding protein Era